MGIGEDCCKRGKGNCSAVMQRPRTYVLEPTLLKDFEPDIDPFVALGHGVLSVENGVLRVLIVCLSLDEHGTNIDTNKVVLLPW